MEPGDGGGGSSEGRPAVDRIVVSRRLDFRTIEFISEGGSYCFDTVTFAGC